MFQNRLSELREGKGYNMKQTAAKLGIPYTTYVSYERGDREPDSEKLIQLSNFFNCSIDYLVCQSDNPNRHASSGNIEEQMCDNAVKENFCSNIYKLRSTKGLSQAEVANRIGLTVASYQNYECGRREAGYDVIVKLADLYQVSIDVLFGRHNELDAMDVLDSLVAREDTSGKDVKQSYMDLPKDMRAVMHLLMRVVSKHQSE